MGIIEDVISFSTNQIAIIISIITSGVLLTKWVINENNKKFDKLEKRILGNDRDGKPGKGGIIDDLRNENRQYTDTVKKDLLHEYQQAQNRLLQEYQKTAMKLTFMTNNITRIEKSLEKVTDGHYTAARRDVDKEMDDDNYIEDNNNDDDYKSNRRYRN